MRRLWNGLLILAVAASLTIASGGMAQALTLPFDKVLTDTGFISGFDFGAVELSDSSDSNFVDVSVQLNDSSPYIDSGTMINYLVFNYHPVIYDSGTLFTTDSGSITNDENNVTIGAFPYKFDLLLSNVNSHSYQGTLGVSGADLDLEDLLFADYGNIYVAMELSGLATAFNGATTIQVGDVPAPVVPEPATMMLLTAGLVGLAGVRRKRIQQTA